MRTRLRLNILPQPDDVTCGPTCLHAVYRYYGDNISLDKVISEVRGVEGGGTLAVFLGCHALSRGYRAKIYTYNLQVFDPSWFRDSSIDIVERLKSQMQHKRVKKLHEASEAYSEFLSRGGKIQFEDLTPGLIRRYLKKSVPVLTGLSATYLYRTAREYGAACDYDDVRGDPSGHFVVLCGYDQTEREVLVADPMLPNPVSKSHQYLVSINRLICSILLGILTYDANLLIIEENPKGTK